MKLGTTEHMTGAKRLSLAMSKPWLYTPPPPHPHPQKNNNNDNSNNNNDDNNN